MHLAEEFALLAYDDRGASVIDGTSLDSGLGGALLLELALAERIEIDGKYVVVADRRPVGVALIDEALTLIDQSEKPRKPGHWVSKLAKNTRDRVMSDLTDRGVVRREKDKVLGLFPRTRYPAAHGVEPAEEAEARQRMHAAVTTGGPVDPRTGALCALVAATGMERKVFPDLDRKLVRKRLKEIGEGAWAAEAVKKNIAAVQSAVMVAVADSSSSSDGGSGGDGGGGS